MSTPAAAVPSAQASQQKSKKDSTKAERRAQQEAQRATKAAAKEASGQGAGISGKAKGGSGSGGAVSGSGGQRGVKEGEGGKGLESKTSSHVTTKSTKDNERRSNERSSRVSPFSHIEPRMPIDTVAASLKGNIHPAVLRLGLQFSRFVIVGANARCIATLEAFKKVIHDYTTPPNTTLSRHIMTHISPQITFLVQARPMSVSMGNAIRFLKYEISLLGIDIPEEKAKERLCERIDHFIRDRIRYAGQVIQEHVHGKIKDGDVILTFARSSVVENVLLSAHRRGIQFSVIVVDSRPHNEGKRLLSNLSSAGVPCTYTMITSLGTVVSQASLVLLGTHALLANGALYSRVGTAAVAMMAKEQEIPVIVCCETYKFSDRIQLDSIVTNELAPPESLVPTGDVSPKTLEDFNSLPKANVLNFLYDLTPPRYVSAIASEVGLSGPESVGVILRDYKQIIFE